MSTTAKLFFYSSRKYLQALYIFPLQTSRDADHCLEMKRWKGRQPDSDFHMTQAWQSFLQNEMRLALVLGCKKKDGLQPWLCVTSPLPDISFCSMINPFPKHKAIRLPRNLALLLFFISLNVWVMILLLTKAEVFNFFQTVIFFPVQNF